MKPLLILIKNKIEISNAPRALKSVLKKTLSLPNPLYYRLLRMGQTRALYATPEYFKYYKDIDGVMYIGRGMKQRLLDYLHKNNIQYEIKEETVSPKIKDQDIVNGIIEREYQDGVIETIERFDNGIIRLGTGFGKSLMALGLIARSKRSSCILVPRVHLVKQFTQECRKWLNYDPGIIQGEEYNIRDITIASIQTLVRRPEIVHRIQDRFSQIIVDECFPYNTKINTQYGLLDIGYIVENNISLDVLSCNLSSSVLQLNPIVRFIKKRIPNKMILMIVNGESIYCTPNHNIYSVTRKKYVKAENIQEREEVYVVRKDFYNTILQSFKKKILLPIMCWKMEKPSTRNKEENVHKREIKKNEYFSEGISPRESRGFRRDEQKNERILSNETRRCFSKKKLRSHDGEKPNEKRRNSKEGGGNVEKDWSQTKNTGWKWAWINKAARNVTWFIGRWMGNRIYSKNKKNITKTTIPLQSRCSQSGINDCNRNRWWKSLYNFTSRTRQEKRQNLKIVRVESIKVYEQSNTKQSRGLSERNKYVYNIEVKNNHNYFANGLLVSNCHTAISKKRLPIIQCFNSKYIFGMTASPFRTDEQGEALFFTFGPIIIDKDMESHVPHIEILRTDLEIPIKEYPDMVSLQINHPLRNQLIVQSVLDEVHKDRRVLILTKRVEHYERLHELLTLKNHLLTIHSISSGTGQKERFQLLADLREGKSDFDILLGTYSLLATGTDIPSLDTLVFAGDLRSSVLQLQAIGRIRRIFEDKQNPKVIDVADYGNGIFLNQFKERKKWYKKQGWNIQ